MELMAISATQIVDVVGINNTTCPDMPVVTAASVITTLNQGPCIGIFHQCAWNEDGGAGHTIHSPLQLEAFGHEVCDKAAAFGGKCMIKTLEGDIIPLSIKDGLPCMEMRKPTESDWDKLPQVTMTSDMPWSPADHDTMKTGKSMISLTVLKLKMEPWSLLMTPVLILIMLMMMIMGRSLIHMD